MIRRCLPRAVRAILSLTIGMCFRRTRGAGGGVGSGSGRGARSTGGDSCSDDDLVSSAGGNGLMSSSPRCSPMSSMLSPRGAQVRPVFVSHTPKLFSPAPNPTRFRPKRCERPRPLARIAPLRSIIVPIRAKLRPARAAVRAARVQLRPASRSPPRLARVSGGSSAKPDVPGPTPARTSLPGARPQERLFARASGRRHAAICRPTCLDPTCSTARIMPQSGAIMPLSASFSHWIMPRSARV